MTCWTRIGTGTGVAVGVAVGLGVGVAVGVAVGLGVGVAASIDTSAGMSVGASLGVSTGASVGTSSWAILIVRRSLAWAVSAPVAPKALTSPRTTSPRRKRVISTDTAANPPSARKNGCLRAAATLG